MSIYISTCSQGLIWAILALGIFITFRVLNFADMTAEGSLTLGGAVCAVLISNGINPILSIVISGFAASIAGLITGVLHTKFKIQAILSGVLTMIALYSINIRIMGKANVSLLGKRTVFSTSNQNFAVGLTVCALLTIVLSLFFKTRLGLAIRATGDNEQMMKAHGANTDFKKILALMLSNAFCGIAGALIGQSQGYADVNMGTGSLVIALASIVIGEAMFTKDAILLKLIAVVFGSIAYRLIVFFVLNFGMNPSDLKLFTAVVVAAFLALPNIRKRIVRSAKNVKN
ncbi:MAG: ABC transporter permease [Oscillospiraceae bacterium]|jgi:putative ABC transport system permease protein|nr:ABC transporter permease [Oscillospiraceae bacterium]